MKKIILLFFTFLGICSCFSQELVRDTITVITKPVTNTLPLKTATINVKEKPSVYVFPNPAKHKIEIEINGFEPGYLKLQLLNNAGKIIREEKRQIFSQKETIIFMFSETPGLYFLVLKQGVKMLKSKLVIQ